MSSSQNESHSGMGNRGVTRPMPLMDSLMAASDNSGNGQGDENSNGDDKSMPPPGERQPMLAEHHKKTLWIWWTLILLGIWTLVNPLTFGYGSTVAMPPEGRELWLSPQGRVAAMTWSDIISGALLILLGWRALVPNRPVTVWLLCGVGVWMNAAPLLFWAPTAGSYLNGTLVGTLVIALTILVPGMPNMLNYMKMGPQTPPGWSYNPSSWTQRSILIILGLAGWLVSRYLAAFQMGYVQTIWDPFFGEGTRKVLTSKMSESIPVSDGGLGAFAYTFEFLMGWMGSPARWRTMPWMVTIFGILVIPLGLVHIFLVASQPVVVGEWCTMCLLAAAIMLPMIPLEVDEVIAMCQFMARRKKEGASLWKVFWKGDTIDGGGPDERSPDFADFPRRPWKVYLASVWGMTLPWNLVAASLVGALTMGSPALFGSTGPMADLGHIAGALIVTISVISMGEPLRASRYLNYLPALALLVLPFLMNNASTAAVIYAICAGLATSILSWRKGPVQESFANWDRWIV